MPWAITVCICRQFLPKLYSGGNRSESIAGSLRASLVAQTDPIPVFLPGESHGQRSLVGYSPRGHKESDMTEQLSTHRLRWRKAPIGRQSAGWGVSEAGKGQQPQELMMGLRGVGGWLNNFLYFPETLNLFWTHLSLISHWGPHKALNPYIL